VRRVVDISLVHYSETLLFILLYSTTSLIHWSRVARSSLWTSANWY